MANAEWDFEGLNRRLLAQCPGLLHQWLPGGVLRGHEFECGDLDGNPGQSLKVNTSSGAWADFATDARGGDLISLFAQIRHGGDNAAAFRELDGGDARPALHTVSDKPTRADWCPISPIPDAAPPPDLNQVIYNVRPTTVWTYRDAAGAALFHVRRFDPVGKRKQFLPLSYGTLDGRLGWHPKHPAKPRPLYRLDELARRPAVQVILTEGEKAADAAQMLIPEAVVTCWPAGCKSWKDSDFSPLKGRKILVWLDADDEGRGTTPKVAAHLVAVGADTVATIVEPDHEGVKGWDAANAAAEGWDSERLKAWIGTAARIHQPDAPASRGPSHETPPPDDAPPAEPDDRDYDDVQDEPGMSPQAPIPLGYDRGRYFYLSPETRQVETLTPAEHTRPNLSHLASAAHFWERSRFLGKKGVAWSEAADWLMTCCKQAGVFDPGRIRGRGANLDDGRVVMHLGDRLLVNGQSTPIQAFRTKQVYEAAHALPVEIGEPLNTKQSHALVDVCEAIGWSSPEMALLFAGWLVIAPVCGAMPWRPHVWITGASGTGKTWIMENIVIPTVGATALIVGAKTTEAFLRQKLRTDARPVLFEEAETQNQYDRLRMQMVLDLARQASSENAPDIGKGSATGQAVSFRIRSAFLMQSINLNLTQAADESRFVSLSLADPKLTPADERQAAFDALRRLAATTLTPEFAGGLLARTLSLLPVIRANSDVFAQTAAETFGSRRQGDTLGTILAGLYSLHSTKAIDLAQARQFMAEREWIRDVAERTETVPDHERCLQHLLQQRVRVTPSLELQVVELVDRVANNRDGYDEAVTHLRRTGLMVRDGHLYVSNASIDLKGRFGNTEWPNYRDTLRQMPGVSAAGPMRMGPGPVVRATTIPLDQIFGNAHGNTEQQLL